MKGPLPYLVRRLIWIPLFVIAVVTLVTAIPIWLRWLYDRWAEIDAWIDAQLREREVEPDDEGLE